MRNWTFKDTNFTTYPVYNGDDLGVTWSKGKLRIKIWAPTAWRYCFRLYKSADAGQPEKMFPLEKSESGTWRIELNGDYEGSLYTFQVRDEAGWLNECSRHWRPDYRGKRAQGIYLRSGFNES